MKDLLQKIKSIYAERTSREKLLFIAGMLVIAFLLIDGAVAPVMTRFRTQKSTLTKLRQDYAGVPVILETYLGLSQRRELIENKYQEVSFEEGVLSHIEKLIVDVAKIENRTDFKIDSLSERQFGGNYVHEPLRIELTSTSLEDLSNFLGELVRGERPLVLTRLQLKKSKSTSKLVVQLDVSNFRRKA